MVPRVEVLQPCPGDMSIYLRSRHIVMTQKFLNRTNIRAIAKKRRGKTVSQSMAVDTLIGDACFFHRSAKKFPDHTLVKMVPAKFAGYGVGTGAGRRKDESPCPGTKSSRILSG